MARMYWRSVKTENSKTHERPTNLFSIQGFNPQLTHQLSSNAIFAIKEMFPSKQYLELHLLLMGENVFIKNSNFTKVMIKWQKLLERFVTS